MKNLNQYQDGTTLGRENSSDIGCPFCEEIKGASYKVFSDDVQCEFDSRIISVGEKSDVVCFPDLSPFRYGHILITTSIHTYNFSEISKKSTIYCFEQVIKYISKNSKSCEEIFFFEHGGSSCISKRGCVQHTHIHAIPVRKGDYREVISLVPNYGSVSVEEFSCLISLHSSIVDLSDKEHYVMFGRCNSKGELRARYITSDFVPSQLMRYLLSELLGQPMHIDSISERTSQFRNTKDYLDSIFSPVEGAE